MTNGIFGRLTAGNLVTGFCTFAVAIYAICISYGLATGHMPNPRHIPRLFTEGITGAFCRFISGIFFMLVFWALAMAIFGYNSHGLVYVIAMVAGAIIGATYLVFRGIVALGRFIWRHLPGSTWMKVLVAVGIGIIIPSSIIFFIIL